MLSNRIGTQQRPSEFIPTLGAGVRSLDKIKVPNCAFDLGEVPKTVQSSPAVEEIFLAIKEEKTLHTALGFDSNDKGIIPLNTTIGSIDLTVSAKIDFSKQIVIDDQKIYFLVKKRVTSNERMIDNVVMLDSASQLVVAPDLNSFYALYGDKFITEITRGSEVIVVIQLDSKSHSSAIANDGQSNLGGNIINKITADLQLQHQGDRESFKGGSKAAAWVYTAGVKGAESFVLDCTDLGSMMSSVATLLQFSSDLSSGVALSCKTDFYSRAQVKQPIIVPGQPVALVRQSDLTRLLMELDSYIRMIKGFWEDIDDVKQTATIYIKKFDDLWHKMHSEHEKYKDQDWQVCQENRDRIRKINQALEEMSGDVLSTIYSNEDLQFLREELNICSTEIRILASGHNASEIHESNHRERGHVHFFKKEHSKKHHHHKEKGRSDELEAYDSGYETNL